MKFQFAVKINVYVVTKATMFVEIIFPKSQYKIIHTNEKNIEKLLFYTAVKEDGCISFKMH